MKEEEKEMWEWLNGEVCSKCGTTVLPNNYPYHHCENCRRDVKTLKEFKKTSVDVEQEWNMYHCGLCEVEFAVNRYNDYAESSCPKCESGESVYFLRTELIGRNAHFIGDY